MAMFVSGIGSPPTSLPADRQPEGHPGGGTPVIGHDPQATVPFVELAAGERLPDIEQTMKEERRQEHQRRSFSRRHDKQAERDACHLVPDDSAGVAAAAHQPRRDIADRTPDRTQQEGGDDLSPGREPDGRCRGGQPDAQGSAERPWRGRNPSQPPAGGKEHGGVRPRHGGFRRRV